MREPITVSKRCGNDWHFIQISLPTSVDTNHSTLMDLSGQVLLAPILYFSRHKTYIKICHLDLSNSNLMTSDSQYRKTTFLLNSVQS